MFHSRRLWSTLRHLAIGAGATLILMNAASLPASAQVRSLTPPSSAAVPGFDLPRTNDPASIASQSRAAAMFVCQNPASGFSGDVRRFHACYHQALRAALAKASTGVLLADTGKATFVGR